MNVAIGSENGLRNYTVGHMTVVHNSIRNVSGLQVPLFSCAEVLLVFVLFEDIHLFLEKSREELRSNFF